VTEHRLFLSHSSGDNPLVLAIQQRLAGVAAPKLLLDISGLEANRPWRRDLHEWLARCSAGLVLLTRSVLDRPEWVLKEAIILGFRKDLEEQDFGLFWALGPGVTRQQFLDKGFALAQFGDTQRMKALARIEDVDALVDELVQRLPPQPCRTPHDELVEALSELLQAARSPEITCPKIARHLNLAVPPHWGPDRIAQLADGVAAAIFRGRDEGLGIDRLMGELRLWTREDKRRLAELLAPHWVDPGPAAVLRSIAPALPAAAPPRAAAVAIRGAQVPQFTAQMYLLRAYGQQEFLRAGAVDGDSPDMFGTIRGDICEFVRQRGLLEGQLKDDTVVQALRSWPDPIYVPLYTLPDEATLKLLRAEFPRVIFIVSEALPGSDQVLDLEPPPPVAVEAAEAQAWQRASKSFT